MYQQSLKQPGPELLHARYAHRIRRRVYALLGSDDECDDIVQEVLTTTIMKMGSLRDPAALDAWVSQVTINMLRYFLRRRRLRRHASLEALQEGDLPTVQRNTDATNLAFRVIGVIRQLPEKDRSLLTRYWFTPATVESLATEAGCADITLRRRLARARARFEKLGRRDPALAPCFDNAKTRWRRWSFPTRVARHPTDSAGPERASTPSAA